MGDENEALHGRTREVYRAAATGWDRVRNRELFEKPWLDRMLEHVPAGGEILDLGCGAGEPIAAYLIAQGFAVTGADFAPEMLALARARWPDLDWIEADMRRLDLGRRFDAIVAWNSFFHLNRAEQRAMFPVFAAHLRPGGVLLLTSGPEDGERIGSVEGMAVYHASLAPEDYRASMRAAGLHPTAFVPEDPDCAGHSVWLVRKND